MTFNKENLKKTRSDRKTIQINMKISPQQSRWLKEQDYSPTAIFQEALKELGFEE